MPATQADILLRILERANISLVTSTILATGIKICRTTVSVVLKKS